jgi:hypothetical protein
MTKTFRDEFEEIIKFIEKKGLSTAFDNVMGLATFDKIVDIIIPTPELREDMHEYLRDLMVGMMEVEYTDKADETLIGYA